MNVLTDLIKIEETNNVKVTGFNNESFCVFLNNLFYKENKSIIVVTNSLYEANKIYSSLANYNDSTFLFPMDDFLTSEAIAISPDLLINRMETLKECSKVDNRIIITNLMGFLRFLPTKEKYNSSIIDINVGMVIEPSELFKKLIDSGYKSETLVTKTGEVGLRGFVIDFLH